MICTTGEHYPSQKLRKSGLKIRKFDPELPEFCEIVNEEGERKQIRNKQ
jgi:hypothetical protein